MRIRFPLGIVFHCFHFQFLIGFPPSVGCADISPAGGDISGVRFSRGMRFRRHEGMMPYGAIGGAAQFGRSMIAPTGGAMDN
ncbi:MAG: hypothetical protein IJS31_06450 [Oscillospiraceae bacterium]|nr:hypothetical protein [Oscillospiraceae bacterium]